MSARHIRLLCLLCWLLATQKVHAAIDVLDRMDITHGVDESTIHIHLNIPVSYKLHVPEHSGDLLRIFVEPLPSPGAAADALLGRESIQWSPDKRVPLFDVTYEGGGFGNTTINLRFQKEVEFEIPKSTDFRTLDVIIKHPNPGKPDTRERPATAKSQPESQRTPPPQQPVAPALPADRVGALMEEARQKMTAEDYSGAIRIYTKVSQSAENQYSQDALEFLGLARERKAQMAQAKQVYKQYLERYPDGEGAARVRQRLLALITVRKQPREKLRTPQARSSKQTADWSMFGGLSQFYRRDESTTGLDEDDEITTVTQSSLDTNMDMTARRRSDDFDIRTRFTGGYLHDFLDDGVNSETTVSSMYFDAQNKNHELSMRLGRQSRSSGGVLGRFDGLLLGFPLGKKFSVSAVAGYPVESSRDNVETDRYFYGLTLAADGFAKGWDANIFAIEQRLEGFTDRRAIGGELRYFDPSLSFFSLVDYDIHYNELNIWQFLGNWILPDRTTINLTLDYRNSPILTTRNALTGQGVDSLDDLQDNFSDSEIYDLARDRTTTSKLATLGVSRPLHEKLQISGDITVTNLSDTDESGDVEATVGSGTDFFYNMQLIGSNLITTGDITILGLRYADTDDTNITSLTFNMRYPVTRNLRINPRFRVDYRKNRDDNTDQIIYRPALRTSYQVRRKLRLEAEIGGEYSDREIVDGSTKDRSYFFSIGYRSDF